MAIEDEESVTIQMTIAEDRKSFEIKLNSTMEMSSSDIILAIECWLSDSLLEGYSYHELTH